MIPFYFIHRYLDLKRQLDVLKIPYVENFNLVRGLDYYTHTAFEITSGDLGSQATHKFKIIKKQVAQLLTLSKSQSASKTTSD